MAGISFNLVSLQLKSPKIFEIIKHLQKNKVCSKKTYNLVKNMSMRTFHDLRCKSTEGLDIIWLWEK